MPQTKEDTVHIFTGDDGSTVHIRTGSDFEDEFGDGDFDKLTAERLGGVASVGADISEPPVRRSKTDAVKGNYWVSDHSGATPAKDRK